MPLSARCDGAGAGIRCRQFVRGQPRSTMPTLTAEGGGARRIADSVEPRRVGDRCSLSHCRTGATVVSPIWMPWSRPALTLTRGQPSMLMARACSQTTGTAPRRRQVTMLIEKIVGNLGDKRRWRQYRARVRASRELPHDGRGAGAIPDVLRGDHDGGRPGGRPDVDARRSHRPVRGGRGGRNPDRRGRGWQALSFG
jgi:hypothetical protein